MESKKLEQNLSHNLSEIEKLSTLAMDTLKKLIAQPSFSAEEDKTATIIEDVFKKLDIHFKRKHHNVWVKNKYFDELLPTILLNSHHDTVLPNSGYTLDPFSPIVKDGKLFGLGSNDAGGPLVSLMATFLYFYDKKLKYNFIFAATAEEETSGSNGIASILNELGTIDFAIVGEPTSMQMAIAEKGLIVLDCIAKGTSSHAAHHNPDNAIYHALKDVEWIQNYTFPKSSTTLGNVKMTVTVIHSGKQHNVVPNECQYTIDVRTNEHYQNDEVVDIINEHICAEIQPRSLRLNSSKIEINHPIVIAGIKAGCETYGSPTISDQSLMNFSSVKIGPGDTKRSHSSDEFIFLEEIKTGIYKYIEILTQIV
jgi:acetylornithine deacetylase